MLESHKLIFFTVAGVGDATWRRLFRRVMGFSDWKNVSRKFEGLRYLYDYNVSKATAMMTSPEYTRAIFVRDPKSRILSNYLEHVVKDNGEFVLGGDCCSGKEKCRKRFMQFESFLNVIQTCDEPFWRPQSWKMEPKYYPYLNFVGHYATIQEDTQRLLEKISAWDYGSSGWGKSSKQSIFYKTPVVTNATFEEYYTSDEIEKKAQKCFKVDYDNKLLGLSRRVRFEEHKAIPGSVVQKMLASNNTPSFLWGIASVEGEEETRKMVRETYLSFYQDTDEPNRICTLADIQSRKVPFEDCQIAYTFFLGGNPDGPTELLKPNSSFPMTIAYPPTDEDDVIYLNIKENMEDGKSQTWLKYASIVAEDFPFDYVAKIDSDTLLFTPAFLEFAKETLPARPNNALIYGGFPHSKGSCDPKVNDTHTCPLPLIGSVYMGGALYWMSNDLASFVTSDAVDRKAITIGHEDIDIGNFIFSHSNKVKAVAVEGNKILIHPEYDADWKHRVRTTTFDGVLWGHTENNLWPGVR